MNENIKAIWIATLRSGNYKQGRGRLRDLNNRCCCLGVLCDIVDPAGWQEAFEIGWFHRRIDTMPSKAVMKKAGLNGDVARRLATLNDDGATFKQIADLLENMEEWSDDK